MPLLAFHSCVDYIITMATQTNVEGILHLSHILLLVAFYQVDDICGFARGCGSYGEGLSNTPVVSSAPCFQPYQESYS